MKKYFLTIAVGLCLPSFVFGQIYSYSNLAKYFSSTYSSGTARMQALGGNYSVLGADVTSIASNPAGLGFYNRSEVHLSMAQQNSSTSSNYLGSNAKQTDALFHLPTLGLVLAGDPNIRSKWHGAFGISFVRHVVFTQPVYVSGVNNRSSLLDSFIEKANDKKATGASLDEEYSPASNYADSPEAAAYQAYLIDPNPSTGGVPFTRYESNLPTSQVGEVVNSGAMSSWNFGYGASYLDKLYIGAGLQFSKISSSTTSNWTEEYIGGKYVAGMNYRETLVTNGSGISLSLGMIYKWNSNLRVALNFQSPTYFDQMNERYDARISPNVNGIPSFDSNGTPIIITRVRPVYVTPNEFTYQMTSPMTLSGGLAYFFGKRAFLSMDVAYINYPGMRVSSAELSSSANRQFQDKHNGQIKRDFDSALNVKIGTEVRVTTNWSVRAGVAQFGGGYSTTYDSMDRNSLQLSGGIGYRSSSFYLDLTVVQRSAKDGYTPYSLKNAADYSSAMLTKNNLQLMLGAGILF
ncbi:hypothetical protein [Aquirufa rosea]|uniref:Transporter n=1 Tax=Aquirufa rosea TaxID=2509241 RepID=A0A4Q1BXI6_9BACT|nr:hypothetical protein [Aquirufa rosea]RXK47114.1 hypothetical protein ESB04_10970 [Aquirufa rosea]